MLALRGSHTALKSGLEQNLFADDDSFAFVRALDASGCSATSSTAADAGLLIVVNKSDKSKSIDLSLSETALAGCTQFTAEAPATGAAPVTGDGKLHIEQAPESMTVYEVR
jgi:hypothetical protein